MGSHVLFHLSKKHDKIRAIYRSQSKIEKVRHVFSYYTDEEDLFDRIDWVKCDLNDLPGLRSVFDGISQVYHCAALVSLDPADYQRLRKSNIEGTANIVNLCLEFKVSKLGYLSSVAALGGKDINQPVTEDSHWNPDGDHHVYAITKYGAELEVWRGIQEGLKAVIVNPGIIIGPGFWKSSSGALFTRISRGMKYYTTAINGYVDIQDVVNGLILLMESDISNERFIQVAENLSSKTFIDIVADEIEVKAPQKKASATMLRIGWRIDWLRSKILGKRRRLTRRLSKMLQRDTFYDNSKLKEMTGFSYKPVSQSVKETARFFIDDQA